MDDVCNFLRRSFESLSSRDVFDECKSELIAVGKDAGLARYLPGLLWLSDCCQNAVLEL